jgi:hypothetical protein
MTKESKEKKRKREKAKEKELSSTVDAEKTNVLPNIFITSRDRFQVVRPPTRPSKTNSRPVRKIRFDEELPSTFGSRSKTETIPIYPPSSCHPLKLSSPFKMKRGESVGAEAAFFRPLSTWGGKSRGYAVGYESSWSVDPELVRVARNRTRSSTELSSGVAFTLREDRGEGKGEERVEERYWSGWKYRRDTMRRGIMGQT